MAQNRSWKEEDVIKCFDLLNHTKAHLVIRPGGTLSKILFQNDIEKIKAIIGDTSNLGTTEDERYKNYLAKVKENSFGKWLFRHADFKRAHALFQKKLRARKSSGYQIEWAELRFLWCACVVGIYIYYGDGGDPTPHPNSRQVGQAIKTAKKLKNSLIVGVRLEDYLKTQQLRQLLTELLDTLESKKRKPRSDETSNGRKFVASISNLLLENFGEVSPEIVMHLASVMGYTAHDTAIQDQIRTARKKHREAKRAAVVDALVKTQKITA